MTLTDLAAGAALADPEDVADLIDRAAGIFVSGEALTRLADEAEAAGMDRKSFYSASNTPRRGSDRQASVRSGSEWSGMEWPF